MSLILEQEIIEEKEEDIANKFVPICGSNYYTPVTETTYYLKEVSYMIGGRRYIENAD